MGGGGIECNRYVGARRTRGTSDVSASEAAWGPSRKRARVEVKVHQVQGHGLAWPVGWQSKSKGGGESSRTRACVFSVLLL